MYPEDHILNKSELLSYKDEFELMLEEFTNTLSNSEFISLKQKFQLHQGSFSLKPFIQAATETTIVRYFLKNFPNSFKYEPKLNNKKNVECQISSGDFTFNIEVKTPDYTEKEKIDDSPGFKISATGRFDNFNEVSNMLKVPIESSDTKERDSQEIHISRRMDNNLKDYLLSANEKFPEISTEKHINILFVCCGDPDDMQDFENYLHDIRGFFTRESYVDHNLYSNVDCVVLTNLYYNHSPRFNRMSEVSWDFAKSFNLIYSNPFRRLVKIEGLAQLLSMFPNWTTEYINYFNQIAKKEPILILPMKRFVYEVLAEKRKEYYF